MWKHDPAQPATDPAQPATLLNAVKKDNMKDQIIAKMYHEVITEAPKSSEMIAFYFDNCGYSFSGTLNFSIDELDIVEAGYRTLCQKRMFTEMFAVDYFETLMYYFLGEVLLREYNAQWFAYKGKMHVVNPIVVRFVKKSVVWILADFVVTL